jgi:hypothetical protein
MEQRLLQAVKLMFPPVEARLQIKEIRFTSSVMHQVAMRDIPAGFCVKH